MKKTTLLIYFSFLFSLSYSQSSSILPTNGDFLNNSSGANEFAVRGVITVSSASTTGIRGQNLATNVGGYGVWGSHEGIGYGVFGSSVTGRGVYGVANNGTGIWGNSNSGNAVYGNSSTGNAIYGISTSGVGVFGTSNLNNAAAFLNTTPGNSNHTLLVTTNGTGAIGYFSKISSSGNGAGVVIQKNNPYGGVFTLNPHADLEIRHTVNNTQGMTGLRILNTGGNGNNWTFYTVNDGGELTLFANGVRKGGFDYTTGAYTTISDARSKVNIENYSTTLDKMLQVKVKSYRLINSDKTEVGLLAQEVIKVFPELVYTHSDDKGGKSYSMDYARIGVIAFKAIQEQQVLIQQQQKAIISLIAEINEIKKSIKNIKN